MACIDNYSILSDRQVVTEIAYSDRAWDLVTANDFGQSNIPHRICVLVEGAMTKGMTFQVVVANKADFTDAQVLMASKAFLQSELVAGFRHYFTVTPAGIKYRYLALKYLPTGVDTESDDEKPQYPCPPRPVLDDTAAPANSVSAWHCTIADYETYYPYVNANKQTL